MIQPEILISDESVRRQIMEAIEAFNARDLDRWTSFYAEDALHYQPSRAEPFRGRAAIREDYRTSTWVAFPDFQFELVRAFGEGRWYCIEGTFTGTHQGPLTGPDGSVVAPTHRPVRVPICFVLKLGNGEAVEVHEYNDQLGLLAQLGLAT